VNFEHAVIAPGHFVHPSLLFRSSDYILYGIMASSSYENNPGSGVVFHALTQRHDPAQRLPRASLPDAFHIIEGESA